MARVAGVDLPPNKRAQIGLTYIYGIGRSRATSILQEAQINLDTRVKDLNEDELGRIRAILDNQGEIEGDLRKRIQMDIKRLMDIQRLTASSRSSRARPAHAHQRTHPQRTAPRDHRQEEGAGQEVTTVFGFQFLVFGKSLKAIV